VCGVAGALAADRALAILGGDRSPFGRIATYDGLSDRLRIVPVRARAGCALCGEMSTIATLDASRYVTTACDVEGDRIRGSRPTLTIGDHDHG
jgi:adenylyltransferase/sulfurtransferase